MPRKDLSENKIKFLTWLVGFLLVTLTVVSAWNTGAIDKVDTRVDHTNEKIAQLPREFVRLERYQCDTALIRADLTLIMQKLDRLAER